jgi:hypothetical protein
MADLLSSGALLAAVLSLFYTLWYPEIRLALDTLKPRDHVEDSQKDIETLAAIQRRRVRPLLVGSSVMTIALVPDAYGVIRRSVEALATAWTYDAVSTLYLLMLGFMIGLVIHVRRLFIDCRQLAKRLRHE